MKSTYPLLVILVHGLLALALNVPAQTAEGVNGPVYAIKAYRTTFDCGGGGGCCEYTELIVGGQFTMAGNVPVNNIARWNGSTWEALGSGVNGTVYAIEAVARFGGDTTPDIYVGGVFTDQGSRIARYNRSSGWSAMGSGVNASGAGGMQPGYASVRAIKSIGGEIWVGGRFSHAGGLNSWNIAKWLPATFVWQGVGTGMTFCDGTSWTQPGVGKAATMVTSIAPGTPLLVGVSTNGIPSPPSSPFFNGDREGMFALQSAQWVGQCRLPVVKAVGGNLSSIAYLGGWPVQAPPSSPATWENTYGKQAGVIEKTGGTLRLLGGGGTALPPLGGSPYWPVGSVPSGWKPIGSVNAMANFGGEYYFAGNFNILSGAYSGQRIADSGTISNIFKWNGSTWSRVQNAAGTCAAGGIGVNGIVHALDVDVGGCTPELQGIWVGGEFTSAGGYQASRIARWNGSEWRPLGNAPPIVRIDSIQPSERVITSANGNTTMPGFLIDGYACDADGTLVSVEFLANGVVVSTAGSLSNPLGFWQPTAAGTYTVTARATDNLGALGTSGGFSYSVSAGSVPPVPAAPSSLAATVVSGSQINLSWSDNSPSELGFRIERSTDGSTWSQIAEVAFNLVQYSDQGLTPGVTYFYRIRAYNYSQNSPYSATASGQTAPPAPLYVLDTPGHVYQSGYAAQGFALSRLHDATHGTLIGGAVAGESYNPVGVGLRAMVRSISTGNDVYPQNLCTCVPYEIVHGIAGGTMVGCGGYTGVVSPMAGTVSSGGWTKYLCGGVSGEARGISPTKGYPGNLLNDYVAVGRFVKTGVTHGAFYQLLSDPIHTELTGLSGSTVTAANAINEYLVVVGRSGSWAVTRACVWKPVISLNPIQLPQIAGAGANESSEALGINSAGTIVGYAYRSGIKRPCRWIFDGTQYQAFELPSLAANAQGQANDIGDNGDVVGTCSNGSGDRGCVWKGGLVYDLNSRIGSTTPNIDIGSYVLVTATRINNSGAISGTFSISVWSQSRIYLLTPQ